MMPILRAALGLPRRCGRGRTSRPTFPRDFRRVGAPAPRRARGPFFGAGPVRGGGADTTAAVTVASMEDEHPEAAYASPLPTRLRQPQARRMVNGNSPLHASVSAQERDELADSIVRSSYEKPPLNQDELAHDDSAAPSSDHPASAAHPPKTPTKRTSPPTNRAASRLSEPARDARDTAPGQPSPITSRPASPYMQKAIDFDGLSWPSIGTRDRKEATPEEAKARREKLAGAVRTILECIGEDPTREGLLKTPDRYAEAMLTFTQGYQENVRDLVNGAVFHEDHDELVIVRDIEVFSLCEHHMVPFTGRMHIGYIPNRRVIGLSKLGRLADMFARRLQVQERLTKQVALAIAEVLKPRGVGVVMESSHLCMVMRGVGKTTSSTTTSCMLGCMRTSAKTRDEFLSLLHKR